MDTPLFNMKFEEDTGDFTITQGETQIRMDILTAAVFAAFVLKTATGSELKITKIDPG